MKKAIIICLAIILILSVILVLVCCNPAGSSNDDTQFAGDTVEDTSDATDTNDSGIQEDEDWVDEIDTAPPTDDTTEGASPTEPENTGDGGSAPTDPPATNNGSTPTDPPAQDTTEDTSNQTTQGGIDLPVIPG